MISKYFTYLFISLSVVAFGFMLPKQKATATTDNVFASFENRFLDAYWKQHPSDAIFVGYGKYYGKLIIPGNATVASDIAFAKRWLDSLSKVNVTRINNNNKISLNIIKINYNVISGISLFSDSRNGMHPYITSALTATTFLISRMPRWINGLSFLRIIYNM